MSTTTPGYTPALGLPRTTQIDASEADPVLVQELTDIYNAFVTLALYVNAFEARFALYVSTHP